MRMRLLPLTIEQRRDEHPRGDRRWLPSWQYARATAFVRKNVDRSDLAAMLDSDQVSAPRLMAEQVFPRSFPRRLLEE